MASKPEDVSWLMRRAESLGRALRCAASELSRAGSQARGRASTATVVDVSVADCLALGAASDGSRYLPRFVHDVIVSIADESKASVVAIGKLLGGIDVYWHACKAHLRSRHRLAVNHDEPMRPLLELMCELLVHASSLCCHAIVRARWAAALEADSINEDLLLAHTTDMGPWLWEHPEMRRNVVWLHNMLQGQPIEAGLLGIVAACGTGSAVVNALRPQTTPLMEDPGFLPPDLDGDLFGDVPSSLPGFGQPSDAVLSVRTSSTDAQASGSDSQSARPLVIVEAVPKAQQPSTDRPRTVVSQLSEALASLLHKAFTPTALLASGAALSNPSGPTATGSAGRTGRSVMAGMAAAVDTSPSFRSGSPLTATHPGRVGGLQGIGAGVGAGAGAAGTGAGQAGSGDSEASAWLLKATDLSVEGFADRAKEYADSTARGVVMGLAATAVVGTTLWAGAGLVHHLGQAASPKLKSRCLEALEAASDAAAKGTAELGRMAFGRDEAAAVRLQAWGGGAEEAAEAGPKATTRQGSPVTDSGAGDPWSAASGAFGQSVLSDVASRLSDASLAAASYGRFIRAMRRHSGAWIAPPVSASASSSSAQLRLAQPAGAKVGHCSPKAHAHGERRSGDDGCGICGDAAGEGAEDAASEAQQTEPAHAAASFLLSIACGGLTVGDAIAAVRASPVSPVASVASSLSSSSSSSSPVAAASEGSAGGTAASGAGTGSTAIKKSSKAAKDLRGIATRSQTPFELLRVDSPTDATLRLMLDRMYNLEVVEPSTALLHDDESYAPDCAFCLEPMLPHERLVRSTHGVCSRHHVFHAACFPLSWAQDKGCPMCREPVFALRPAAVDTPFSLHSADHTS